MAERKQTTERVQWTCGQCDARYATDVATSDRKPYPITQASCSSCGARHDLQLHPDSEGTMRLLVAPAFSLVILGEPRADGRAARIAELRGELEQLEAAEKIGGEPEAPRVFAAVDVEQIEAPAAREPADVRIGDGV